MEVDSEVDISISQLQITVAEDSISEISEFSAQTSEPPETSKRSTRNKIKPLKHEKRRVQGKPKRLNEESTSKAIINYYLDKRIKRNTTTLETIFEDPASNLVMSRRKYSRCMNFPVEISLSKNNRKIKKRSMKAKQRGSFKPKKVNMDLLLKKLASIDDEEDQ